MHSHGLNGRNSTSLTPPPLSEITSLARSLFSKRPWSQARFRAGGASLVLPFLPAPPRTPARRVGIIEMESGHRARGADDTACGGLGSKQVGKVLYLYGELGWQQTRNDNKVPPSCLFFSFCCSYSTQVMSRYRHAHPTYMCVVSILHVLIMYKVCKSSMLCPGTFPRIRNGRFPLQW